MYSQELIPEDTREKEKKINTITILYMVDVWTSKCSQNEIIFCLLKTWKFQNSEIITNDVIQ